MAMEFVRCSVCCKARYGSSQEMKTISPPLCSPCPAKVFQYFRRFVPNIELMFESFYDYSIKLFLIFDHRSEVNFHLLRCALAPLFTPLFPSPPPPARATTSKEDIWGGGGAHNREREAGQILKIYLFFSD